MSTHLPVDPEALADFCRTHGIRKLSLFGSLLKGTARADSDIDLLVEFEPDKKPGLIAFAGMEIELRDLLGGERSISGRRGTCRTTSETKSSGRPRRSMSDDDRGRAIEVIGEAASQLSEATRAKAPEVPSCTGARILPPRVVRDRVCLLAPLAVRRRTPPPCSPRAAGR